MSKKLILHDMDNPPLDWTKLETVVWPAKPKISSCMGCFGCWVKTPGQCVINDRGREMPPLLGIADEVIFISRLVFGHLSPEVKTVIERSLASLLPFMVIKKGRMVHEGRRVHNFSLKAVFYGHNSEEARNLAADIMVGNAFNLGALSCETLFFADLPELLEKFCP
jgi:multimeric flavodoxin WrbA